MCEQQRAALDMIKGQTKRGGLSKSALILHEKQCQDFEKMGDRMTTIENKVDALERKVDSMDNKLDRVLETLNNRLSISDKIRDILNNKIFLYILITILCASFGVSVGEVGVFLFK